MSCNFNNQLFKWMNNDRITYGVKFIGIENNAQEDSCKIQKETKPNRTWVYSVNETNAQQRKVPKCCCTGRKGLLGYHTEMLQTGSRGGPVMGQFK